MPLVVVKIMVVLLVMTVVVVVVAVELVVFLTVTTSIESIVCVFVKSIWKQVTYHKHSLVTIAALKLF